MCSRVPTARFRLFLRGLTGYHVVNLIDGIRFNNSTFRSGPNQYLAYIEPSQAQRLEAVLGPAGAQYGSDSLGGTIQVLTEPARFATGGREIHGDLLPSAAPADLSGGAGAQSCRRPVVFAGWVAPRRAATTTCVPVGGAIPATCFRRLFGLAPDQVRGLLGGRLQDSGFGQQGAHTRLSFRLPGQQTLTMWYQGSRLTECPRLQGPAGRAGPAAIGFRPAAAALLLHAL